MEKTVAVVLITYNRLELLKEVLAGIKAQTYPLDSIIVVNNGSTDGTKEWLESLDYITLITQDNVGSSGGQYTGIKAAAATGAEWIWTMDDDVVPASDCLEQLMSIEGEELVRAPLRYSVDGDVFYNDVLNLNLSNPFSSIWDGILSQKDLKNNIIPAEGITFEGPVFKASYVASVGLPEKKFFIYADDTDYMIRLTKAGAKCVIVRDAKLQRKLPVPKIDIALNWKSYYMVRNIIAIDRLHGDLFVSLLRPFAYLLSWSMKCKSVKELKTVFKAFVDGYLYKSDN
jgi:GT2 family glycosyltransferase